MKKVNKTLLKGDSTFIHFAWFSVKMWGMSGIQDYTDMV